MAQVYDPADDSFLFADFLREYLAEREGEIEYLDMGTGSGILSVTASSIIPKGRILAADSNPSSVEMVKAKGFNVVLSDLFSHISGSFDLITFNAPYLPYDAREPADSQISTTGGVRGDELAVEFVRQSLLHLNDKGRIFLLVSSLTPLDGLQQFSPREVKRKKIFMEELIILEFLKSPSVSL